MNIHFDIKQSYGFYYLGIPDDRKAEQKEIQQIKAEWPRPYPYIASYTQESLDRAKEGWTKTGKTYHLLSKDDKGYPVTHEYPEYFDGENKFIVVKHYDEFYIRKVTPVTWKQNKEGFLYFASSGDGHLLHDFIDLPTNLGTPGFDEKTLKEYFNQFFATEMIVNQRYEKEPPVLTTELANRNYTLKQENAELKQKNETLEAENAKLTKELERAQKEIEELTAHLQEMEQETHKQNNKIKWFKDAVKNTNALSLKKLKETVKTL
ncbi:MAG: hypothetical protein J6W08_03490 [Alphaproteobacteria bacterium]|nr:hypothetical protein [Alphaproteobacteria bacterium]